MFSWNWKQLSKVLIQNMRYASGPLFYPSTVCLSLIRNGLCARLAVMKTWRETGRKGWYMSNYINWTKIIGERSDGAIFKNLKFCVQAIVSMYKWGRESGYNNECLQTSVKTRQRLCHVWACRRQSEQRVSPHLSTLQHCVLRADKSTLII